MSTQCLRAIALIVTAVIAGCGGAPPSTPVWGQVHQALGAPTVTSFTPASGKAGTLVTVKGTGFIGLSVVRFNGTAADLTVRSDTELSAVVPEGATTGPLSLTHPANGTGTSSGDFTVPVATPPVITAFSPQYGVPGTSVTLQGANLSAAAVQFNGVPGTVTSNTATQLVITVPETARSGPILVGTAQGSVTSQTPFTVVSSGPPTLSSFSPASGARNTVVTLTGTRLGTASEVTFNGVAASYVGVMSDTRVSVSVPQGASTGLIRVYNNAGSAVSTTSFTIPPEPKLSSFTPMSGAPGTSVTLTGENFPSTPAANALSFNGVAATNLVVVSATRMTATVPAGATTGPLSFNAGGFGVSSVARFSVLSTAAPVISGFSPASGQASTRVTLTGSRLTGTREVTVNGVTATGLSLSGDTSLSFYVPTGATTGPIRVFNTAGSATSTTDFTVPPPPATAGGPVLSGFSPTMGPTGTLVTLTGSGFTGTTMAFQGGRGARFTVIDDGHLSVSVPPGGTTGKFNIFTAGGSTLSTASFTVTGSAPPVITSILSNNGADPVSISGAYFTGTTSVKFNGVEASSFSLQGDGLLTAYRPSGAFTTGRITVTNSEGTATSPQDFVVAPPLVLTSLTPASGPPGTTVSVVGSGFSRISHASLGVAAVFKVISDTRLEVTVPRATAASLNLILRTPTDVTSSAFTVTAEAAPTLNGFTPDVGVPNTSVTVFGSGFSGTSEVTVNGTPASFSVQWDGQLFFSVPPGATTGPIQVKTSAGTATSRTALVIPSAPTISGFTPSEGGAGTPVTLTGTGFTYVQGVTFANSRAASFSVSSDTELTSFVPGGTVDGPISVSLGNILGMSTARFTVTSTCVPTVSGFTPSRGGDATIVNVAGSCFTGTSSVSINGVKSPAISISSDTSLTARLPAGAGTGPIRVTNTLGTGSSAEDFIYIPPPSLLGFTPASGPPGTVVSLTGKDLATAFLVSFGGKTVNFWVVSDTELAVTIPPEVTRGYFFVNTLGGIVISNRAFGVPETPAPTLSELLPSSGPTTGGLPVTLHGTGFVSGITVTFDGKAATSVTFDSSTSITATVPAHAAGAVEVVISNPDGQKATLAGGFTYLAPPAPSVTSISPGSGPSTGGTSVTIHGTSFADGATVKFGTVAATAVTFGSDTSLVAIAPAQAAGRVAVTVVLSDGQEASLSNAYTYTEAPGVTLASVNPSTGTTQGGTDVTLTGTGFASGATVTFGDQAATDVRVTSEHSISARTPAHAAGGVDVRVHNPDGTEVLLANGFIYQAPEVLTPAGPEPTKGGCSTGGPELSLLALLGVGRLLGRRLSEKRPS